MNNLVHLFNIMVMSLTAAIVYLTLGFFTVEFISSFLEGKGVRFPTYAKVIIFILNPIIIIAALLVSILNFIFNKLNTQVPKW